ncbi:hypothetical protein TWF481_002773 [Arthrobotrys musiformis]|uniref:Uncharacterized protein n=1 Tax=Arthrobotrys musiformis TaxID=47236 RepID=A0AAV9VTM4_9PEZI
MNAPEPEGSVVKWAQSLLEGEIPRGLRFKITPQKLQDRIDIISSARSSKDAINKAKKALRQLRSEFSQHQGIMEQYSITYQASSEHPGQSDSVFPVFKPRPSEVTELAKFIKRAHDFTLQTGAGVFVVEFPQEALVSANSVQPPNQVGCRNKTQVPYFRQTVRPIHSIAEKQREEPKSKKQKDNPIGYRVLQAGCGGKGTDLGRWDEPLADSMTEEAAERERQKPRWGVRYYGDLDATEELVQMLQISHPEMTQIQGCALRQIELGISGLDSPYLYLSEPGSMFALHCEDLGTISLNYHCRGNPKVWDLGICELLVR